MTTTHCPVCHGTGLPPTAGKCHNPACPFPGAYQPPTSLKGAFQDPIRPFSRPLNERGQKEALGCKRGPKGGLDWPPEGIAPHYHKGVLTYVLPKGKRESFRFRAYAVCPSCKRHVPLGRIWQHSCESRRSKRRGGGEGRGEEYAYKLWALLTGPRESDPIEKA